MDCKSLRSINIPGTVTDVGQWAFSYCESLTEVRLSSLEVRFDLGVFHESTRLIELADAAGFQSSNFDKYGENLGEGVEPFLVACFEREVRKRHLLAAAHKFVAIVHRGQGTELERVEAAKERFPASFFFRAGSVGDFLKMTRAGEKDVLGVILDFI